MKTHLLALLASACVMIGAEAEPGFVSLWDGKTFNGWKKAVENPNTWQIEDGVLVTRGERCHLFYEGDGKPFKNFELRVDVMTERNSNGGIYIHTKYQERDWPKVGFETQVNNTHGDWKKTGSIYDVVNVGTAAAKDGEWWTQTVIVQGNKITVKVNDKVVVEYTEPPGAQARKDFTRKIDEGTFALQAHDPKSVVRFKNLRVKRLD